MKKVFRNAEDTIHTFAQQSQEEGRCSNVFFYGKICYSYGYHFPLAIFTENAKGEKAILLNGRKYSNTTTGHQYAMEAATRQYNQVISFGLDRYSGADQDGHKRNETHYIREFETIARNLVTARKPAKYIFQAQTLNAQYCLYTDFFALTPSPEYQTAFKNATEASEEIRQQMKAYQAEERKRKAAKAIEEAKAMEVKIQEWIAGERQSLYPRPKIDILRVIQYDESTHVETSQGVKMTITDAKLIYLQLLRHELKAGDKVLTGYTVSKVNGTVNIGCHTFDTEYLLNFGKSL